MLSLKLKHTDYYNSMMTNMSANNSYVKDQEDKFLKELNSWGFTAEQKSEALSNFYVSQTQVILQSVSAGTIQLLELEYKAELLKNQSDQVIRQIQGYDDNLLLKLVENQSGLASFAVNAGSDSAQDTIDDLKELMCVVEKRVSTLVNNTEGVSCVVPA